MRTYFRIIFFTPDLFAGSRFAIGALVEVGGVVRVAFAKRFPCEECVGGFQSNRLLMDFADLLPARVTTIARLPDFAGPHFSLDVERCVPGQHEDPVAWCRNFLLPGGAGRKS